MGLFWIISLHHCYNIEQRPPQTLGFLNTFPLFLFAVLCSYWEGGISRGMGLEGILRVHCFQCPSKGIEPIHKMSLGSLGALSITRLLHANSGQMAPLSCYSPCTRALWVMPGNSTLPQLLQATPSAVSMCALIKKQGSHPEMYSSHGAG